MSYYSAPLIKDSNGVLRVAEDGSYYSESIFISTTAAYVLARDGVTAPTDWTTISQSDWDKYANPAPTLDQVKQAKLQSLLSSLDASFTTFQSSALGSVHNYPIDAEAQNNFDRLQQRAILDTSKNDFNFKTIEDGTLVLHTRAQFLVLLQDAETFIVTQTKHYDSLVAQVNAATDVATVNGITW